MSLTHREIEMVERDIRNGKRCPECFETFGPMGDCDCAERAAELAAELSDETAGDDIPAALTADTDYGWIIPESRAFAAQLAAELGKPGFFAHDDFAIAAIECIVQARAALAAYDIEVWSEARDGVPTHVMRRLTDITRTEAGKLTMAWRKTCELAIAAGIPADDAADAIAAIAPIGGVGFHGHLTLGHYVRILMD